jgi:hypothetical protein
MKTRKKKQTKPVSEIYQPFDFSKAGDRKRKENALREAPKEFGLRLNMTEAVTVEQTGSKILKGETP